MELCITLMLLFLCGSGLLPVAKTKSTFSMMISEYRKDSYRRLDGQCCGSGSAREGGNSNGPTSPTTCIEPCIQQFRICLEYAQAVIDDTSPTPYAGPCVYGDRQTSVWGSSERSFKPQHSYSYDFEITVSWPSQITIIIEAYDVSAKSYRSAIIDRFVHRGIIKPSLPLSQSQSGRGTELSTNKPEWHILTKQNGAGSVYRLNFRLVCGEHYYGAYCAKYCTAEINDTFKCDTNGDKICHHGWMGPNCNTTICKSGCHPLHGYCHTPGECKCTEGWKGPFCDECIKYPGCKHGSCVDSPWTCHCDHNWAGQFCDKSLSYCAEKKPCVNGGFCENLVSDTNPYQCVCPSGFSGINCEIDSCMPNPCKKGTCLKTKESFYCQCFEGWIGKFCDKDSRNCDSQSCQNGGRCLEASGSIMRCKCSSGFRGSECHLADPCQNSRCRHAVDCQARSSRSGDYACRCQAGWTGAFCDISSLICGMQDDVNGYQCKCKAGFRGRNCHVNVACQSSPCVNGGVCQETVDGFVCKCKTGYSGRKCEIFKTGCSPNPCRNGAYCYTIDLDFFCECSPEFWGKRCEHRRPYCGSSNPDTSRFNIDLPDDHRENGIMACDRIHDACSMPPTALASNNGSIVVSNQPICGHYGSCVSSGNQNFVCRCMSGFDGDHCQINVDDCASRPCQNRGVCIDGIDDFQCLCDTGYHGKTCEKVEAPCAKNPCMHDGVCRENPTSFYSEFVCECNNGWGGRFCHQPSHAVCNDSPCMNRGSCLALTTSQESGFFKCNCAAGWTGFICQIKELSARPCNKLPNRPDGHCSNKGVCVNVGDSDYACHCPAGYEGDFCEKNINECHPNPCFNGGTCKDLINSYKCECTPGYYGTNCQSNFDDCAKHPCAYGAVCIDRINRFECRCPAGRTGLLCDKVVNGNPPQLPSCVFHNRIFDSGEVWTYNCKKCECRTGHIRCKKIHCGVWSCLKAKDVDDPYACKTGETCHSFHFDPQRCFVPPCVPKAICLRNNDPIPPGNRLSGVTWPGSSSRYCRPNDDDKNNYCAKIQLVFEKRNMPLGVSVDDLCEDIKKLAVVRSYYSQPDGQSLGISCDISLRQQSIINVAIYSPSSTMKYLKTTETQRPFAHYLTDKIADNLIDVVRSNYSALSGLVDIKVETLLLNPDNEDNSTLIKFMLVPIIFIGILIFCFIIWHHKRQMQDIKDKFNSANTKFNNSNSQKKLMPQASANFSQYQSKRSIPTTNPHIANPNHMYEEKLIQDQGQMVRIPVPFMR